MESLRGKNAIITGAGKGSGKAILPSSSFATGMCEIGDCIAIVNRFIANLLLGHPYCKHEGYLYHF